MGSRPKPSRGPSLSLGHTFKRHLESPRVIHSSLAQRHHATQRRRHPHRSNRPKCQHLQHPSRNIDRLRPRRRKCPCKRLVASDHRHGRRQSDIKFILPFDGCRYSRRRNAVCDAARGAETYRVCWTGEETCFGRDGGGVCAGVGGQYSGGAGE